MTMQRRPDAPRPVHRTAVCVLLAGLLLVLVTGCGGPRSVSLADLAFDMERYDGSAVTTTGVVVGFDESDGALAQHYVIQDASANRVQLLPDDVAEPHEGRTVTVTGQFEFDPDRGRLLHVETIEPAG